MREVFGKYRAHVLGGLLNSGGEGAVYEVVSVPQLAIKINSRPRDQRAGETAEDVHARYGNRINAMVALMDAQRWIRQIDGAGRNTSTHEHILAAWPLEPVRQNPGGRIIGYLMVRLDSSRYHPIEALFTPAERVRLFPQATWRFLIDVAISLAQLLDELHLRGIVVGDLSPPNLFVTSWGNVTLVDCDSTQFTDRASGEVFLCPVARWSFTAPELHGKDLHTYVRAKPADRFALAVIICSLLLLGTHPHLGYPTESSDDDADEGEDVVATNVARGRSHIFIDPPMNLKKLPRVAVPAEVLPRKALSLARRCFGPGAQDPRRRPSARQWVAALQEARDGLVECPRKTSHVFAADKASCPWCEYQATTGQELFP